MSREWLELEYLIAGLQAPPLVAIHTVSGTAVNEFTGFPADLARMLGDELWWWLPCRYPAMTFPMDRSVDVAVENLVANVLATPSAFVLCGYSQGAIAVARAWRDELLNPGGRLHHRLSDVFAIITYGDPMRATGIAHGNQIAGVPVPGGGGISGEIGGRIDRNLTPAQTPNFYLAFAHEGDIYTNIPTGTLVGADMTAIFDIVMLSNGVMSFAAILKVALSVLRSPLKGMVGVVGAIIKGLRFVAGPVPTLEHVNYDIGPAARWLTQRRARSAT